MLPFAVVIMCTEWLLSGNSSRDVANKQLTHMSLNGTVHSVAGQLCVHAITFV